ncbi:hypothetical protein OEZ85_012731 [Tetradesmus obliquus]|uniref:GH16 domain-containing protein n=1 Tax=Tetradesmus obliquus TaxID=3088 RepID=A0ABY8U472_TETOB|nr:hypothetical protein OEZ85_012731 [Tetradesmus obliquus]WIA15995.1 hypothetical protein OEZ85_012731 [Tetradesmus obliquus]
MGGYLGCFNLSQLQVDSAKHAKFSSSTISKCMPFCNSEQHTMHVVSHAFDCWCMTLIPDESARLPATACSSGGNGVAVFYRFKEANKQMCRLAPVALKKDSFDIHYNEHHASFVDNDSGTPEMILEQQGPDGIRLATNDGMHLYGQFQVTAKIAGASGVVTAFYVRSTDTYTLANKDSPFHEIDIEFLNGNPAPQNSIWLNSYKNGISGGETLVKPADYQALLGLVPGQTAENTFITYGFNWQPDYVMWSLNGKALQKRLYGQNITWTEMDGRSYWRSYRPPSAASHITFSMWSDGDQMRAFGGKLDLSKSPYRSRFTGLKRILCDEPLPSEPAAAAAALGPAWLFGSSSSSSSSSGGGSSSPSSSSSSAIRLPEVLGAAGKTLTTAQVSAAAAAAGAADVLCLEKWKGQVSGSSLGFSRVAAYPCSSSSTIWVFDRSTGLLRDSSTPGSCLSQELVWKAGEANVLSYLATAKPLVTSAHEATGFCLHPSSSGSLLVKPCLPSAAANPNWKFDPSSSQILLKGSRSPTLCLSGSASEEGVAVAVAVAACAAGAKEQQWQLSAARHLRSAGGVCLGLGASGEVAAVACGSAAEAVWSFGGDSPLHSLNPGRTLTQANGQHTTPLAVSLDTSPAAVSAALALKPASSSSRNAISWTFNETYAGSGVGQLAATATHAAGGHAGMCMTSRDDVQAVQLSPCQRKGQALFKAQLWMWFGGQLKNSGDGKCLAQGPGGQLRPVSCPAVKEADKLLWAL